jgi:phosphatidylglycerol:prolipoprotein diacylglycerol transferase
MRFASPGPALLTVGPFTLRWYGVLLASAAVIGLLLAQRQASRQGEDVEAFMSTCGVALGGGIVGARLYHVALQWDVFRRAPWRILAVWEGGVAIFGGVIGGVALVVAYTWWKRLPLGRYLDLIAPSLILGQAIGRWGNFFNEEAFGRPTDLPWGLYVSPTRRPRGWEQFQSFHPTFLYESLADFGIFLALVLVFRPRCRSAPGRLFLVYLALYALVRIPIEALRLDSEWLGPFRSAHVMAVLCLLVSVPLLVRSRPRPPATPRAPRQ